jgi:hypothetical protein
MTHPNEYHLSRFADGDLPPDQLAELELHVESCNSCRQYVDGVRRLGGLVRKLNPPVPPGLVDEVIRRRAAGERVALPVDGERPPARMLTLQRFAAAATVVLIAGVASYLLLQAPPLEATRGELRITPDVPRPGTTAEFVYRPASYLADEDSLRVRARARKSGDRPPRGGLIGQLRTAMLRRQSDGTYRGQLPVGEDDVFLAAVVEAFDGREIDTNFGQLWEIFVAGETGGPSSEALEARYRILEPYNYVMATGWAQEITRQYPSEPFGWTTLLVHERAVHADSLPTERLRFHHAKLDTLIARFDREPATAEQLAWLASYANRLGRDQARDALYDRVRELNPAHPMLLNHLALELLIRGGSSDQKLAALDSLWSAHGAGSETMILAAVREAAVGGDSAAARRWLERNRRNDLAPTSHVLAMMSLDPDLDEVRIRLMREHLDSLRATGDEARPLRLSRDQYVVEHRQAVAGQELALAEALVAAGDTAEAFDLYRSAAAHLWRQIDLSRYADFLISHGDVAEARQIVARLAADPLSGERALSDYESILPPTGRPGRAELLAAGRREYRSILYGSLPPPRPVHGNPEVRLADDTESRLRDFLGGQPTVLVLYEPSRGVEHILEPVRKYAEQGIRSVLVARTGIVTLNVEPAPVSTIPEAPIIVERSREIADALSAFGTTSYVVVDPDERIIAETPDHEKAYRAAAVSTWN